MAGTLLKYICRYCTVLHRTVPSGSVLVCIFRFFTVLCLQVLYCVCRYCTVSAYSSLCLAAGTVLTYVYIYRIVRPCHLSPVTCPLYCTLRCLQVLYFTVLCLKILNCTLFAGTLLYSACRYFTLLGLQVLSCTLSASTLLYSVCRYYTVFCMQVLYCILSAGTLLYSVCRYCAVLCLQEFYFTVS